jgi:hypothetical protein
LNVQKLVYPFALPKSPHKDSFIQPIFIPITRSIIEQIPIGFPNSMFPFVGPYTPYFGFGHDGMGNVPTMWPQVFSPFANITATLNLVSRVAQVGVVTNNEEPWDDGNISFERKHNPKMPQIFPIKNLYNEKKWQTILIRSDGGLLANGGNVIAVVDLLTLEVMIFEEVMITNF